MKHYRHYLIICSLLAMACNKYVDIQPKGRSLLNTVTDLNYVMNYNFSGAGFNHEDLYVLCNDMYPANTNLPTAIALPAQQQNAFLTYYVPARQVPLNDNKIERLYGFIAAMNTVINNADAAIGDAVLAKQLKAEALIMRGYFHYLIINIYAKAFNPDNAAKDGGIPYVTDTDLVGVNAKLSVADVYMHIIADINNALDNLPVTPVNIMRPGKAFGYGFKSAVMLTMREYGAAITAADSSLLFNSNMEDQTVYASTAMATRPNTAPDNLFYSFYISSRPANYVPSIEVLNNYEPGNVIRYYTATYKSTTGWGNISNSPTGDGTLLQWVSASYFLNTGGLTVEDIMLVKAECLARTGNYQGTADMLNSIRVKRIRPADYSPLSAATEAEAMKYLMRTARIEHLFTYKNFFDLKRWNTFEAYKQTITRTINGQTFSLPPDSPLWIFPFPESITIYNSTVTQNY